MSAASRIREKLNKQQRQIDRTDTPFLSHLDPLKYILDGSYPRTVDVKGATVWYMPLTLAEERELEDPEAKVVRMVTKAYNYRILSGLEDKGELCDLRPGESLESNVRAFLNDFETSDRLNILYYVQAMYLKDLKELEQAFVKYREEYHGKHGGSSRRATPLDTIVSYFNIFAGSGYRLKDIAEMTRLQFEFFSMVRSEAEVRKANDAEDIQAQNKARQDAKTGAAKGKERSTGSLG